MCLYLDRNDTRLFAKSFCCCSESVTENIFTSLHDNITVSSTPFMHFNLRACYQESRQRKRSQLQLDRVVKIWFNPISHPINLNEYTTQGVQAIISFPMQCTYTCLGTCLGFGLSGKTTLQPGSAPNLTRDVHVDGIVSISNNLMSNFTYINFVVKDAIRYIFWQNRHAEIINQHNS